MLQYQCTAAIVAWRISRAQSGMRSGEAAGRCLPIELASKGQATPRRTNPRHGRDSCDAESTSSLGSPHVPIHDSNVFNSICGSELSDTPLGRCIGDIHNQHLAKCCAEGNAVACRIA